MDERNSIGAVHDVRRRRQHEGVVRLRGPPIDRKCNNKKREARRSFAAKHTKMLPEVAAYLVARNTRRTPHHKVVTHFLRKQFRIVDKSSKPPNATTRATDLAKSVSADFSTPVSSLR